MKEQFKTQNDPEKTCFSLCSPAALVPGCPGRVDTTMISPRFERLQIPKALFRFHRPCVISVYHFPEKNPREA